MPGRAALPLLLAALAAAAPRPARAGDGPALGWLVPDHGKAQLAGTIGLVSAGAGWALAGDRLELDVLAGWVPARHAGEDLLVLTAKATWLPWRVGVGGGWALRPLTASVALSHTSGDQFWIVLPDRYPRLYYELPSALRGSVSLGGAVGRRAGRWREVGLYWEVVASDVPLAYWIGNPGAVDAADVLSLAFGVRLAR